MNEIIIKISYLIFFLLLTKPQLNFNLPTYYINSISYCLLFYFIILGFVNDLFLIQVMVMVVSS